MCLKKQQSLWATGEETIVFSVIRRTIITQTLGQEGFTWAIYRNYILWHCEWGLPAAAILDGPVRRCESGGLERKQWAPGADDVYTALCRKENTP